MDPDDRPPDDRIPWQYSLAGVFGLIALCGVALAVYRAFGHTLLVRVALIGLALETVLFALGRLVRHLSEDPRDPDAEHYGEAFEFHLAFLPTWAVATVVVWRDAQFGAELLFSAICGLFVAALGLGPALLIAAVWRRG